MHSDLDVIHDSYEPSSLSFFDHVFGFFSGIRQRGLQTTEEILRDGSFITQLYIGIGWKSFEITGIKHWPNVFDNSHKKLTDSSI